jgi:hypothetical protein
MLKRMVLLSCLGLLAPACAGADQASVDRLTGSFPPFSELRDVRLGMRARDLVRTRPEARPEGYVGYRETVTGHEVSYLVPGSYSEEQEVPAGARVAGVTVARRFPVPSAAAEAWRSAVTSVRPEFGPSTPRCFRVVGGAAPGRVAVWKQGRTEFVVSTYAAYVERHAGGSESRPATVLAELRRESLGRHLWSTLLPDSRQVGPRRVPEPCPEPREATDR